MILNLVYYIFY